MMIIDNKKNNTPLVRVISAINIQILTYIKYSLVIPLVLFCAVIIIMILVLIQEFIFGGTLEPLLSLFHLPADFEGDKNDILIMYGWLSLIFYIIGSLIEALFKSKTSMSLKRKLGIALLINLLVSLPVVLTSFLLLSNESTITSIFISLAAFSFGMIFSALAFVSGFIIDKTINFLNKRRSNVVH